MKPLVSASTRVSAQFYDLDPMNVVWHGNYPRFFELARVELLDKIGYGYQEMRSSGYMWPIIEMQARYYRPLTFGQPADIAAHLVEWENRLKITYEIRDVETCSRLTKGHTVQVALLHDTGEMLWETPEIFRQKLSGYLP